MTSLMQDIQKSSLWLISAFKELNKQLDYSIMSVKLIDALIDEQFIGDKPKTGSLFINGYGSKVFAIGCYIGETIIKNTPATKWETNDNDREGEINVRLISANDVILFPVQKTIKRIKNGSEDQLYAYVNLAVDDLLKYKD